MGPGWSAYAKCASVAGSALLKQGDCLAQWHEVTALTAFRFGNRVLGDGVGASKLVAQPCVLGLELHHPADALDVHPLGGEIGDPLQDLDVGVAVTPVAALGARRPDETTAL